MAVIIADIVHYCILWYTITTIVVVYVVVVAVAVVHH